MTTILHNTANSNARVFGPTGAVILVPPQKAVETPYAIAELTVENGAGVTITVKPQKAADKKAAEQKADDKKFVDKKADEQKADAKQDG